MNYLVIENEHFWNNNFLLSGNIFFSKIFLHTPTISLERAAREGPQNVVTLKKKTIPLSF